MIDKKYWLDKWDNNDVKFNQLDVNSYLKSHYQQLKLRVNDPIFIPFCGKSIDMLWLAEQGHFIIGIELSVLACEQFFKENTIAYTIKELEGFSVYQSDQITIFCGDFYQLTSDHISNVKGVYDRGGFVAVSPDEQQKYAKHMAKILPLHCKILLNIVEYPHDRLIGPPFSVSADTINQLYSDQFQLERIEHSIYQPPQHLIDKGIAEGNHSVYLLTKLE